MPDCDNCFALLVVGETQTYSCTSAGVTADFTNSVDAAGTDPLGTVVASTDTADVTVLVPGVEVQKTPDYQMIGAGGTATFTITVTNTGEVALTNVAITDLAVPTCDATFATLAVSEAQTYTCDAAGVAADFTNVVDVSADAPFSTVTDTDTADVDVVTPVIDIQKTPDLQTLLAGETATFTVTVTNSGDIDVANVSISDPLAPGCDATIALLAAGTSQSVTCDVTNVLADFTNVATYTAPNPLGGPDLTESDDAVVDVVEPGVVISKTPDLQQVVVGDAATFTITVTNDGDQDLVDVTVTDPATPDCDAFFASILVGDSETYTCATAALTTDFTNIASVAGADVLGNPVSDSDDGAVDVIDPAISISKTPDLQQVTGRWRRHLHDDRDEHR